MSFQSSIAIDLSRGEPDFAPPSSVSEVARVALEKVQMRYGPPGGLPRLRTALAAKVQTANKINAEADQVVVTSGASLALTTALLAACSRPGAILCPNPGFPAYSRLVRVLGYEAMPYTVTPERIELPKLSAGNQTRALIWNSPHNPTGRVASNDEIRGLLEYCSRNNLVLLSDEVYEDFVFEGEHASPASFNADVPVYTIFSFSKSYAMSGWRVGYVVAPASTAETIERLHHVLALATPMLSQLAALAALAAPQAYRSAIQQQLSDNRLAVGSALAKGDFSFSVPAGGIFYWIDTSRVATTGGEFVARLWQDQRLQVAEGAPFVGRETSHIRLHFAVERDVLQEACKRIAQCYARS